MKNQKQLKRAFISLLIIILVMLVSFALYLIIHARNGNFHTVLRKKVYRSAQLDSHQLLSVIRNYGIKSIIDLEGQSNKAWYKDEVSISKDKGINHYTLSLPAHGTITKSQLTKLIYILEHAPKPILVHCRSGSDRSGLASAISVIFSGATSFDAFEDQISWQYGVVSPTSVGYVVLKNYSNYLKASNLKNNRKNFILWANSVDILQNHYGWLFT